MSQASFQKQQREKARRDRAAAKFEKRAERRQTDAAEPAGPTGAPVDETAVLAELAALHEQFAAEQISFDDFEAAKQRLTALLLDVG